MTITEKTMIEFRDVHKYYGDYHALRGINGTIRAGEFFSLLGPSGCGKTTLLRTIAGFEDISSGVIMIDGKDMADVAPNARPTNMVFQSYAIFPHMSVAENVGFGLRRDPRHRHHGRHRLAEEEWASEAEQRVAFNEGVGVHGEHVRKARRIHACIQ